MYSTGLGDGVLNISARDFFCRGLSPFQFSDYCSQYREHQDLVNPSKSTFDPPPMPPTIAPPADLTSPSAPSGTLDTLIAGQQKSWQDANQNFFNNQPSGDGSSDTPATDWTLPALILGGVAMFMIFRK